MGRRRYRFQTTGTVQKSHLLGAAAGDHHGVGHHVAALALEIVAGRGDAAGEIPFDRPFAVDGGHLARLEVAQQLRPGLLGHADHDRVGVVGGLVGKDADVDPAQHDRHRRGCGNGPPARRPAARSP